MPCLQNPAVCALPEQKTHGSRVYPYAFQSRNARTWWTIPTWRGIADELNSTTKTTNYKQLISYLLVTALTVSKIEYNKLTAFFSKLV